MPGYPCRNARVLSEAWRKGNVERFLREQRGPSWLKAFKKVAPLFSDWNYWQNLRTAWQNSKTTKADGYKWLRLFNSSRRFRETLMTEREQTTLKSLPQEVPIWRACGHLSCARGFSWTIDETEIPDLIKNTFSYKSKLGIKTGDEIEIAFCVSATVPKNKIQALFDGSEVVVDPVDVKLISVKRFKI